MKIPDTIRAGSQVNWTEPTAIANGLTVTSATHAGTYYLRSNTAGSGYTATGTAAADGSGGWDFQILPADTATLAAGKWFAEFVISDGVIGIFSIGTDQLTVEASLSYSGVPAAFDGRTQAEIDLARVRATIASIESGGTQMYMIGNRQNMKLQLPQLYKREGQLMMRVNRERAKANGATDPDLILGIFR